jgi:hypothetical protein
MRAGTSPDYRRAAAGRRRSDVAVEEVDDAGDILFGLLHERHVGGILEYHELASRKPGSHILGGLDRASAVVPASQDEHGPWDRGQTVLDFDAAVLGHGEGT